MGWSLGANDAANVFGTGVTSGVIKYKYAVILTAIFVIIGAILEGPKCMEVIGSLGNLSTKLATLVTISAALTVTIMTFLSIPVSTSQAIVGAIVGATLLHGKPDLANLSKIVICWIFTPIGAGIISFLLYLVANKLTERYIRSSESLNFIVKYGLIFAGCYGSYALGANNVANTTGVFVSQGFLTPEIASIIGGISIALGTLTYSKSVMFTVGNKITLIGPLAALVAIMGEAITIHIYTQLGVPVSTSQAIVGAVIGIGLIRGIKAVNKKMVVEILIGWISTPLFAGILSFSAVIFFNLK